jgi:hypothetical protein
MGRTEIPDLSRLQGEPWLVASSFCFPLERVALSLEPMPKYALDNADIVREAIYRQLASCRCAKPCHRKEDGEILIDVTLECC